ncbi:SDR family oxidoreductase [Ideonella sp. A 288]|uniref:SDR family oxidoreductase n=1 Tax=Ideonella sp. A 288 TaxID=1962181 RepID=UPI000B4AA988|nr:SDR family oxidoreductase [Ideonella sp. A 288]
MDIRDKVVVVTGGASGIGRALCLRFAQEGARGVVVADLDEAKAAAVVAELGPALADGAAALAVRTDVSSAAEVLALVDRATRQFGRIDLFCSNAGIISRADQDAPAATWQRHWDVNVMAHVHAANAVLPQMLARGEGYLLQTASAAGLLSQVNAAPYSVTKHAAVGFAEWLSIAHGDAGIRVSCLCPQGVLTPMLLGADGQTGRKSFLADGAVTPEALAEAVVQGLRDERFLILPHQEVLTFWQRKTSDIDRWLKGMRRLRAKVMGAAS